MPNINREALPGLQWPNPDIPITFIGINGNEEKIGISIRNQKEAFAIMEIVSALIKVQF
jgi:hypothetical protein